MNDYTGYAVKPLRPTVKLIMVCPKCGSRLLYKDEDNDDACLCGWRGYLPKINEPTNPIQNPKKETAVKPLDIKTPPIYKVHINKHNVEPKPRGKRGHYRKTASKVEMVILLCKNGKSVRQISSKLSLANNTVMTILKEHRFLVYRGKEVR